MTTKANLNHILIAQNKANKTAYNLAYHTLSANRYSDYNIMDVLLIENYRDAIFIFKLITSNNPHDLYKFFSGQVEVSMRQYHNNADFNVHPFLLTITQYSFLFTAPTVWNLLPVLYQRKYQPNQLQIRAKRLSLYPSAV